MELVVLYTHSDVLWLLWVFALNIPKCFEALSVRNSPLLESLPSASITTLLSIVAVEYWLPAAILKLPPKSWRRVTQLLFYLLMGLEATYYLDSHSVSLWGHAGGHIFWCLRGLQMFWLTASGRIHSISRNTIYCVS